MRPIVLRKRRKKTKYKPILKDTKSWPVVQMAKKRSEFVDLVFEESYENLLDSPRGRTLREELETTVYREIQRIKNNPWKIDPKDERDYFENLQKRIADTDNLPEEEATSKLKEILKNITRRYAEEIAGNFRPSRYRFSRTLITIGFARLLNAARVRGPWSLFSNQLDLDDKIHVVGENDQIRKLARIGTVVMVPTHFSNLDSPLIGWVIQYLGLPPFIYGAGLNLFNVKIFAYFMNSLGAYKVDRRKKNVVYLETLKTYSTIALREGCHSLFFPGGTRSRSGKIEKSLKLGLLGTAIEAQRQIYQNEDDIKSRKIFIVPVTTNYHFVLEAPSLINDYLKSKGQQRYYVEADEFTSSYKISKFLIKFFTKGSGVSVSIGRAIDVVGNYVDEHGNSIDKKGTPIDLRDYFRSEGEITEDSQREQEYNRILGKRIVEEFHKNNRVLSSHLLAFTAFRMIGKRFRHFDLYSLLRLPDEDLRIEYSEFREKVEFFVKEVMAIHERGEVGIGDHMKDEIDDVIKHGLRNLGMYHPEPPLGRAKNGDIVVQNMNLLYFYHNRLLGYDLEKLL
ncbi:1-acyl-sn-glycerol-3-phosphate acyltransferase [Reichenbachiella sp. MALMAid0571]|uniref:1-acyl-sn-glycerol-3-phosphate acyltransferase n=1 Tax=Reichenbachiella sp. MALMAid0571 TaxID=3143939 RepID=UPI0032DFA9FB